MFTFRCYSCSTGELTRGMCVVDRRTPPVEVPPATIVTLSEIAEEKTKDNVHTGQQEVPEQQQAEQAKNRIYVITHTPGSDALVENMFEHIWGSVKKVKWYKRVQAAIKRLVQF